MKWMRERDALIAQTLAFVQSVTGRSAGKPPLPVAPNEPKSNEPKSNEPKLDPAPLARTADLALAPAPPSLAPPPSAEPSGGPILVSEMRRECDARIASFRAHQERFSREREEYFAATLAKLRAAIKDGSPSRRPK